MNTLDIFGHPVLVNYEGKTSYSTCLSSFISTIILTLMLLNLIFLSLHFKNGTMQDEKTTFVQIDRYKSDAYNLKDYDIEIAIFSEDLIDESKNQFSVY